MEGLQLNTSLPLVAFADAVRQRSSGWLRIWEGPEVVHRLGFWQGELIEVELATAAEPAPTTLPPEIDPALLVGRNGALSDAQLDDLVACGLITDASVVKARRWQVLEHLAHLFTMDASAIMLRRSDEPRLAQAWPVVPTPQALMHFARKAAARGVVAAYVDRFRQVKLTLSPELDGAGLALSPAERAVLELLEAGPLSVEELEAQGDPAAVQSVVFSLSLSDGLRAVRPSGWHTKEPSIASNDVTPPMGEVFEDDEDEAPTLVREVRLSDMAPADSLPPPQLVEASDDITAEAGDSGVPSGLRRRSSQPPPVSVAVMALQLRMKRAAVVTALMIALALVVALVLLAT